MSYTLHTRVITEAGTASGRLGRHVEHDSRSRDYEIQLKAPRLFSVRHHRNIPVLDQGSVGSCTGNAATGAIGTGRNFIGAVLQRLSTTDAVADEDLALKLYGEATALDTVSGSYPPDDTGSTGLAVAKAAVQEGLITGYQHAFALSTALAALQVGPVILGINWYEGFDNTGSNGKAKIAGVVLGGHEIVVDEINVEAKTVTATNSWTEDWGRKGRFEFSWSNLERLLGEDGDAMLFAPLSELAPTPSPAPAPTPAAPIPTPTPEDVDRAMWTSMKSWAKARGLEG